jgi:hypothetical protein
MNFVTAILLFWPRSLVTWFAGVWVGCIASSKWAALHMDKGRSQ